MAPAGSIDEVIDALDGVVAWAGDEGSPLGYFAALYRAVTARVGEGIAAGFFDDGERMERLDVVFANRYLDALETFHRGGEPTRSWAVAFEAGTRVTPIVLQHLLLGINAHINLDLGIAAAEVSPGDALPDLRKDFDRINEILASQMQRSQRDLAAISPWLGLLDTLGGRSDDELVRFSVEVARTQAWRFAVELAPLARDAWGGAIRARDRRISTLGRTILRPGLLTGALWLIRLRESKDVRTNLDVLTRVDAPSLAEVDARLREKRTPDRYANDSSSSNRHVQV